MTLVPILLQGYARQKAIDQLKEDHYLHSVSSGKSHYFAFGPCLVVYSMPPNPNIARFLLGKNYQNGDVWELSRLWAPDGHNHNLLTMALSKTLGAFRILERDVKAIVAYADPNAGHHGGIYKAASWHYCGQCAESRLYRDPTGQLIARRTFHSGAQHLTKSEILDRGFIECKAPGKLRYAKGLTNDARRKLQERFDE